METFVKIVFVIAYNTATMLIGAQITDWALSTVGVHAGIWPMYFILATIAMVVGLNNTTSNTK